MTDATRTPPLADYSPERRAAALGWLRDSRIELSTLAYRARLIAAIGLLICDDEGRVSQTALDAALADPSIVQAARTLLREARG